MGFILWLIKQAADAIDVAIEDISEVEIMPFYTCEGEWIVTLCNYDVYVSEKIGAWLDIHHDDYADILQINVAA
jgi:hypothetical protein